MKVLIAVTHLLGVGHLARAATLGRALARAGHAVALVMGGRPAPMVDVTGLEVIQLPPLHVRGTDFRTLFDASGAVAGQAVLEDRQRRIVRAVDHHAPDAVVVELFPFGRRQLAAEFQALLEAAARVRPRPAILCSVRDVLAPPSKPEKATFAEEMLARHFDGVLVHGDPALLPLEASWPVSPGLRKVLRYTGYVADALPAASALQRDGAVIVSGGGSESPLPLLRAALEAARRMPDQQWRLLAGQGVPQHDFDALAASAPSNAVVERARPDFPQLLRAAACSVSQAGYNTMLDIVAAGVPALVVPFEAGNEREQAIRAECFAAAGRVQVLREADLDAARLADSVARVLASAAPHSGANAPPAPDLAGAQRSVAFIGEAVAARRALEAAWDRLDAVLDRYAEGGRTAAFWWRDDDAIAPTPALERLLALAARHALPLALAVIPDKAAPALAARLAPETQVDVLVHGIAHRNNAAPPAKKQELVAGDDTTLAALAKARARNAALFGARALPVLVPPWNRIAPELVPRLAEAGFSGVSTFSQGILAPQEPVTRIDTHLDPIDWKGGGGLVRAPAHIAALTAMLEDGLAGDPPMLRPIGVLTHHLVQDAWVWAFVEDVLERLVAHRAVRFFAARELFGLT